MISSSDIEGRLRLLRYGLVVVVVVTFLVSLLTSYVYLPGVALGSILGNALLFTVVVGIVAAVISFGYSMLLKRNAESGSSS